MYTSFGLAVLFIGHLTLVGAGYLQELRETARCYGVGKEKIIGGVEQDTQTDFDCPSCVQPEHCTANRDLCIRLSNNSVHMFKHGILFQSSPVPAECHAPVSVIEIEPRVYYIIQCESTGKSYQPVRFGVFVNDAETGFETDVERVIIRNGLNYARNPHNTVFINTRFGVYRVSLLGSGNEIAVADGASYTKTITGCAVSHKIFAGPVTNDNLQVIIDCNSTEGSLVRQRILISLANLRLGEPTVQTLYPPLLNDRVTFSLGGSYILYTGTSQLEFIEANQISRTPGIVNFTGPIGQAEFLSDDRILVSIPGENRIIIDIIELFRTSFSRGKYELPDSVANCPHGKCPPFVPDGDRLFLFSETQPPSFYTILSSYNVSNLEQITQTKITSSLRSEMYDFCFLTVANITVLPSPEPPTTPTPPDPPVTPTPPSTPTHFTNGISEGTSGAPPTIPVVPQQTQQLQYILPPAVLAFIVVSVALLCLVIVIIFRHSRKRKHPKTEAQEHCQDTGSIHEFSEIAKHMQPPPHGRPSGSAGTSTNPSSAPSLEQLPDCTSVQSQNGSAGTSTNPSSAPSLGQLQGPTSVQPHIETIVKHVQIPPKGVVGVATTQIVS